RSDQQREKGKAGKASGDSGVTRRAWDVVRLALLWPRRGGAFRRLIAVKFRLAVARFVKSIGERELSFDKTLVFHVKMHRPGASKRSRFRLPRIPCISPDVDFEYGFFDGDWERKSPVAVEDGGECRCG
ncbi:hypothetical protein EUGRSUZ_E02488, partial [Eucalyptus grandis]